LTYWRDRGPTEVGAFGISAPDDLLLIEDVRLVRQLCTSVSVQLDDAAVAEFFDEQVDQGLRPEQFARIWIHTHPANCAEPSLVDEVAFTRVFGATDWSVMCIVPRRGPAYMRLEFHVGPSGTIRLPVEIDNSCTAGACDVSAWNAEYQRCVSIGPHQADDHANP
jgi:hypothetical protein